MGRYAPKLNALSASMEHQLPFDRHFNALSEFLGYHQELSSGSIISEERLDLIESNLRGSMYLDSADLVSLESGFSSSREVSLEGAVGDGLKSIVGFIVKLIMKVFSFVMNVLTLGAWGRLTESISEIKKATEEAIKESAEERAEYEKKYGKRTETVEVRKAASFAPQMKASGYNILKNAIDMVFHIFDMPVFKSVFVDPAKVDPDAFTKGLQQGRDKAKSIVSTLNKNSEFVPFQLQMSLESPKSLFTVTSKSGGDHATGGMIRIARSEYSAILDQTLALSKVSIDCTKKMQQLDKQKDKVIKMLNRSLSIPPNDAQAYAETARVWTTTLQQLSMLLNYSMKVNEDIAKSDFKYV